MSVYVKTVEMIQELITLRDSRQFRAMIEMLTSVDSDSDLSNSIEEALSAMRDIEEVAYHCHEFVESCK